MAGVVADTKPVPTDDAAIRERLYAELRKQPWAPVNLINIVVRNGNQRSRSAVSMMLGAP